MIPKFRAWDKFDKEMLDVHGINYDADGVWTKEMIDDESDGEFIHFSDIEILQSTGLFDKNGKEIFQGDIIHYKIEDKSNDGSPYTLRELTGYIYKEGNCMWVKVNDSEIVPLWCLEDQYVIFKILGNIYEHPHLLGED
ncbi:YopX family protein [Mammaliicoccus sciuri]|uniref:YopX family protein n=1 Tax=Mammaliicoccus sciuri TaxID=1296 RepID=UPI003F542E02